MTQIPAESEPTGTIVPFPARPVADVADGDVVDGQVVDGEVVDEPTPAAELVAVDDRPAPVDQAAVVNARGGRLDQHRAYLTGAPAIIPPYLRDRDQARDAARTTATYYAHKAGFHAARTPAYTLRLWSRAPRGAARVTYQWWRWVTDAEARPVVATAAASGDPGAWMALASTQTRRTQTRQRQTLAVAVPAALLITLAAILLPAWALAAAAAAVLSLLGALGRVADKPIIGRYVSVQLMRPLSSAEVEAALTAIGIKGKTDWPEPIQTDGPGWRAEVDLPAGTTADTVLERRQELAGAMRRPLSTVWPSTAPDVHPARLVLWVARQDPAKTPRRVHPLLKAGVADLFKPIPFGFSPRGELRHVGLMYGNVIAAGVPGSGKTSAMMAITAAGALDVTCEIWIHELKGSGDMEPFRPVCHRYVSGDDDEHCKAALDALRALEAELKRRKAIIADLPVGDVPEGRKVYPHLAARRHLRLWPLLAVFDEVHTAFEHPEYGEEAKDIAGRLIRKARAYGIILVLSTQRPDAKAIPPVVSANAALRFCLAVVGHVANDIVLGTGAYKAGVRATMFDPKRDAGTGWLSRSAHDNEIVRAIYLTQDEATAIGRRALALRTAAGTLTGQAAGDTVEPIDSTDLIDHLLAVWPAGEDAMHSHILVAALAVYRPDLYGTWTATDTGVAEMSDDEQRETRTARSTMLSGALKPHGVRTRQINKRGAGGGGKGLRLDDLPARGSRPEHDPGEE